MDKPSFERLVTTALRRLPRAFREKLENISIQIEDAPSAATLHDMGIRSGTLLGLYQGVPLTERGWGYGNVLPDRIIIYQRPIEEAAASPQDIEDMVLDVVTHEIGHYFGFDDRSLSRMEAEKRKKKRGRPRNS
jgi:predicted Zn-dependent protease with MMP-like domain